MRLIIGGLGQGKRAYAAAAYGLSETDFALDLENAKAARALYGLEEVIAACLQAGTEPEPLIEALVAANPEIILLCRELGCGVVPMDAAQREWRERTGRICCELAKKADSVERVLCGLPLKLK